MSNESKDWPAARIVHLGGGCRAIDNPTGYVELLPNTFGGKRASIKVRQFGALYKSLEDVNLQPIGVDFYRSKDEFLGHRPPNWRAFNRIQGTASPWISIEAADAWSNVSHPAYEAKNGRLWDLSRRIAHQLRVAAWRLREVSQAYSDQLNARIAHGPFKEGIRFQDGYTWLAYLSLQAFLVDACVLRDYLSEFSARFHFAAIGLIGNPEISSLSGLISSLKKVGDSSDPLFQIFDRATAPLGWLAELTAYRNLVVHSAPLSGSGQRLPAVTSLVRLSDIELLPAIRCPIPENPGEIVKLRSTGELFDDFDRQLKSLRQAATGELPSKDGLTYMHEVLEKLAELAALLISYSPLKPKMRVLTEKDIIGPVVVTED